VEIWGIHFLGRRVSMMTYMMSGRVPSHLTQLVVQSEPSDDQADDQADANTELLNDETFSMNAIAQMGAFMRAVITDAVYKPRIIFDETKALGPDEVYASQLPEGWIEEVYKWALHHSPSVPMAAGGGLPLGVGLFRTIENGAAGAT
jgi:hypothetical protein